ncbi:unnamed protein product [Auanema sp. JU1783]|nr:unnamed protein product [Auanema sp. JU1783]
MRKKASAFKEVAPESAKEEKHKEREGTPNNGAEEKILFVISSVTSMGQCPSSWHDYLETVKENSWRFMSSPFSETTLTDRADRPVTGSFGGNYISYRMLSTRLTSLAKQKVLNVPICNFDSVLDFIVRQTEKKIDRIVFVMDSSVALDEQNKLALKNILSRTKCHFLILGSSLEKLNEVKHLVDSSCMNSTFSICKKPDNLLHYVYYFTDLILDRNRVPLKGVPLRLGSKAPVRVKLLRLTKLDKTAKRLINVKKEPAIFNRKVTSWSLKKRQCLRKWKLSGKLEAKNRLNHIETIEIVGFLAASTGEKYINGVGMNELFVLKNAYTEKDCDADSAGFLKKIHTYTNSFMEVFTKSIIKTSSVAFCQVRRAGKKPRYGFLIAVANGIQANEEAPLADCHLVFGLLSTSIHSETWTHLLSFVSAAEAKPTAPHAKSRLITHPNWINGEYLSRDTATKLSKLIKKNSLNDVHEELNRMYTHARVISIGYSWLNDMLKNMMDLARTPEMKSLLVNYQLEASGVLRK